MFLFCLIFNLKVKEIEKRDSVLTPKQQIDRLLRPGSSYFNLNPFEVLQIDPATTIDEVKKKYRRVRKQIFNVSSIVKRMIRINILILADVYISTSR